MVPSTRKVLKLIELTSLLSLSLSLSTPDTKTKATLRRSALLSKVDLLRSSRNSVEVSQLAETTLNNLKVT